MPKKKDWTGYKYNTFEVIGEDIECNNLLKARVKAGEIKKFNRHYLCKCECGNVISVTTNQIAKNRPWSCGCKEIRNSEDLTGKTFGDWTVLSENTERRQSDKENLKTFRTYWNCRCKCGKIKVVSTSHLKDGKSTGCGCTRDAKVSEMRRHDLLGKTFGKLTAIEDAGYKISHGRKLYRWKCRCECGDVSVYTVDDLMSRKITECTKCRAQGFPSVKAKATYNKNQQKIKEEGSLWESLREKYSEEEINESDDFERYLGNQPYRKKVRKKGFSTHGSFGIGGLNIHTKMEANNWSDEYGGGKGCALSGMLGAGYNFNPHWYAGLGVSLYGTTGGENHLNAPLFAEGRYYLFKRNISPFASFRLGAVIPKHCNITGVSPLVGASIGYQIGHFEVAFDYTYAEFDFEDNSGNIDILNDFHWWGFRLGYHF